ncbi:MAG TPA: rhomboid family intramembrane serine protease [Anaerolineales bacterium]|nr:rhomboid family intramembrane serine protease [Anaerolineales bacterium]
MNESPTASNPPPDSDQPAPARQAVRVALPASAPYVTYAIIGITAVFFILQLATQALAGGDIPAALFIKSNQAIRAGQVWRLLTPMLLHASLLHIGFNMYALLSFGVGLERDFGHGRFLLLYLLGAFAGNVASFLFTGANSLGASTAVFGLLGAEGIFLVQNRKLFAGQFRSAIGNIIFIAAINLFLIGSLPGIDNWGHIGGLLGGLMFTSFAGPLYEIEGVYPAYHLVDKRPFSAILVGAATVVLIFGGLAMWGIVR